MADSGQTYKNHTRVYPPFHYVAVPILLLNLLNELRHVWRDPNPSTGFAALVAFGILAAAFAARGMALKVQDRVIRFEQQARVHELTPSQLVALRFASDTELADLVRDVLAGKHANQKSIKLAIRDWQGDYLRA